jgi:SAM-dependent methyltransferase
VDSPRNTLKLLAGRAAEIAFPELAREIDEARNRSRAPKLKRAIVYARLRRADARGDAAGVEKALKAYWQGGPGDSFHVTYADDRFRVFQEKHALAVDALAELLKSSGGKFTRLVEVGCGDGAVLAYCAERLPELTEVVGLDINEAVITRNSAGLPPGGSLKFFTADGREWLTGHPQPGTVMLSNGGVLEYFSQENVARLYEALALAEPAAIVLVEPAAPDHDFLTEPNSFTFGREYSFSHNHRRLLQDAGFAVTFEKETQAFGARLIITIAIRPSPPAGASR